MQQETSFLQTLGTAAIFSVAGDTLTITSNGPAANTQVNNFFRGLIAPARTSPAARIWA